MGNVYVIKPSADISGTVNCYPVYNPGSSGTGRAAAVNAPGGDYAVIDESIVVTNPGHSCVMQMANLTVPVGLRGTGWAPIHRGRSINGNYATLRTDLASNGPLPYQMFGGGSSVTGPAQPGAYSNANNWYQGPTVTMWMHPLYQLTNLQMTTQVSDPYSTAFVGSEYRIAIVTDWAPNAPTILSPGWATIQDQYVVFDWTHNDPEGTSERGWRITIWNDYAVTAGQQYGAGISGAFNGYPNPYAPPYYGPSSTSQAAYDTGLIIGPHTSSFTVGPLAPGNYWAYISTSDGIGGLGYANHSYSHGRSTLVYFTVYGANQSSIV